MIINTKCKFIGTSSLGFIKGERYDLQLSQYTWTNNSTISINACNTVPGRINDSKSEGCNYLIQNNKAARYNKMFPFYPYEIGVTGGINQGILLP